MRQHRDIEVGDVVGYDEVPTGKQRGGPLSLAWRVDGLSPEDLGPADRFAGAGAELVPAERESPTRSAVSRTPNGAPRTANAVRTAATRDNGEPNAATAIACGSGSRRRGRRVDSPIIVTKHTATTPAVTGTATLAAPVSHPGCHALRGTASTPPA